MVNAGLRANCSGNTMGRESHHDSHSRFSHLQDGEKAAPRQQSGCSEWIISEKTLPEQWKEDEEGGEEQSRCQGKRPFRSHVSSEFRFFRLKDILMATLWVITHNLRFDACPHS